MKISNRNEWEHTVMLGIHTTQRCRFLALSVWVAALIFTFVGTAHSQGASGWSPQFELAGGYSFIRANPANAGGLNLNGGSESLAYGLSSPFSAVADLGEYRFSGLGAGLSSTMYTYLFGPRLTSRKNGRLVYFAQILAGGGRLNASSGVVSAGENGFAMAIGGGLDVPFRRHFAVRAIQADYMLTRFDSVAGSPATQDHVRISAGVVVRFGGR